MTWPDGSTYTGQFKVSKHYLSGVIKKDAWLTELCGYEAYCGWLCCRMTSFTAKGLTKWMEVATRVNSKMGLGMVQLRSVASSQIIPTQPCTYLFVCYTVYCRSWNPA